jgi:hypothetical protein
MPGSSGELLPTVIYADIYKKDTIVVTPRKVDGDVLATFHYGKGENVIMFKYKLDGKASERGGDSCVTKDNSVDSKGKEKGGSASYKAFKEWKESDYLNGVW